MDKIDRVKFKDEVLSLLKDKGQCDKRNILSVFSETPWEPYFEDIFRELVDLGLIDVTSRTKDGTSIKISYRGNELLDLGGFTKQYQEEIEKIKDGIQSKRANIKLQELQKENLLLTNQLNKQRLRTHWIPIIISAVSLLLALGSFFKSSLKNESQTDEIIERQKIQDDRMDFLEGKLQKANDSLQHELSTANMLIDVYEN